jgi:transposase-like protein
MVSLTEQELAERRFGPRGRYKPSFIKMVVREVEEGLAFQEAHEKYRMPAVTLTDWLRRYGSEEYLSCRRKRHPASLKRSTCQAVIDGRMTITEAALSLQLNAATLRTWVQQQKEEAVPINTEILKKSKKKSSTPPVTDDVKALQEQLAYANLKIAALNTLIDVAEEQLKINIRKKPGAKQS